MQKYIRNKGRKAGKGKTYLISSILSTTICSPISFLFHGVYRLFYTLYPVFFVFFSWNLKLFCNRISRACWAPHSSCWYETLPWRGWLWMHTILYIQWPHTVFIHDNCAYTSVADKLGRSYLRPFLSLSSYSQPPSSFSFRLHLV